MKIKKNKRVQESSDKNCTNTIKTLHQHKWTTDGEKNNANITSARHGQWNIYTVLFTQSISRIHSQCHLYIDIYYIHMTNLINT